MISERKEASFNQHLDSVENVLHTMEHYSLKLNDQIGDLKKLVATNRRVITRLKENEQRIKLLLEDSPNSLDNQVGPGKEVLSLWNYVEKDQEPVICHMHRNCKVTKIREISWTHCKSLTNDMLTKEVQQNKPYKKSKMVDLRERGGLNRQVSFDLSQHQALIYKANCIVKIIENLDMRTNSIKRVKQVCKQALKAMSERQKELWSEGPRIQKSKKANFYL
nr:uncharacterized protein LOC108080910 [Drosophila kikkawai]